MSHYYDDHIIIFLHCWPSTTRPVTIIWPENRSKKLGTFSNKRSSRWRVNTSITVVCSYTTTATHNNHNRIFFSTQDTFFYCKLSTSHCELLMFCYTIKTNSSHCYRSIEIYCYLCEFILYLCFLTKSNKKMKDTCRQSVITSREITGNKWIITQVR